MNFPINTARTIPIRDIMIATQTIAIRDTMVTIRTAPIRAMITIINGKMEMNANEKKS